MKKKDMALGWEREGSDYVWTKGIHLSCGWGLEIESIRNGQNFTGI